MTRALVTQLVEVLDRMDGWLKVRHLSGLMPDEVALTKAARECLETEPSGERAELIARLAKQWAELDPTDPYRADIGKAADMLEADAHQNKPLTDEQLNALWHKVIDSGDPTAGNAHIRFYRAATKMEIANE